MSINQLTDKQLATMIANYRARGVAEGGKWPLNGLLLEQRRRKPTLFPTRDVAEVILRKSRESSDGLVTYGDIWNAFVDRPWEANNSRRIVADALYRVIGYCVDHALPIMTVLVVRGQGRKLSPEAIGNIYEECRELGVNVGADPQAFVERELQKSLRMTPDELKAE